MCPHNGEPVQFSHAQDVVKVECPAQAGIFRRGEIYYFQPPNGEPRNRRGGRGGERMGRLAIGVDTSGSIDEKILRVFASEIQAALDECQPERIDIIYCGARVQSTEEYVPGDAVTLKNCKGGSGTKFEPVFKHIEDFEELPVSLIYLTDLEGSFPAHAPDYPVLWASIKDRPYPFGEVVSVQ